MRPARPLNGERRLRTFFARHLPFLRIVIPAAALILAAGGIARADFIGHGGMVRALAVSADGSKVLTGSFDYSARLWDFVEQKELGMLDEHTGPVNAVAFVGDGKRGLTAGNDGIVILWDLVTLKFLKKFNGHKNRVMALAASGDVAASGSWDKTVRIWDLNSGALVRTIGQPSPVNTIALGPGGDLLAVGGHDGIVRLWEVASGRPLGSLKGHGLAITQVAVSPDGKFLLSSGIDKTLRLWDLGNFREVRSFAKHENQVYAIAFSPDGKTVLSTGRDGLLIHWNLETGEVIRTIRAHDQIAWAVAFSPDGRFALTASSDEVARMWHLQSGDRIGIPAEGDAAPKPWLTSSHPGARMFRKCALCHALTADGPKRSGPHFSGLFGRRAGSVRGYRYSAALTGLDFDWNDQTLRTLFEKGPDVYLPGTKMPMQQVPDSDQLARLIDYLKELTAVGKSAE